LEKGFDALLGDADRLALELFHKMDENKDKKVTKLEVRR
jgi:hypothetical protein